MLRKILEERLFTGRIKERTRLRCLDDVVADLKLMKVRQWVEKMKESSGDWLLRPRIIQGCSAERMDGSRWGGGGPTPRPGQFTSGNDTVLRYRRLGGPQVPSGRVRKISPPPDFDPRTVEHVACRLPGCTISVHAEKCRANFVLCVMLSCTYYI